MGFWFTPHTKVSEKDLNKVMKLAQEIGPLIVLSEKAGVIIEEQTIVSCDNEPVIIFDKYTRANIAKQV